MKVTRHSNEMRAPSREDPARKQNTYLPIKYISKGILSKRCIGQVSDDILTLIFQRTSVNIWYSFLLSKPKNDDISGRSRQRSDYTLSLWIHTDLLEQNGDRFNIIARKWDTFNRSFVPKISNKL